MKRIWKPLLIIGCIFFVVWLVVYLAVCNFDFTVGTPIVLLSLLFGILSFVLATLCLVITGMHDIRNDESYALMPLVLCCISMAVSLIFNAVITVIARGMALAGDAVFNTRPEYRTLIVVDIAVNVVLLGFSAIDMVYAISHIGRVSIQSAKLQQMQANPLGFSAQLGKLLGMAGTPKVRQALLKLKETVDMSGNTTTPDSAIREKGFGDVLANLEGRIISGASEDEICELAETARKMWLARNAVRG